MSIKMKHMKILSLIAICLLFLSCDKTGIKETYYEKKVVFTPELTLDERVGLASKIVPTPQQAEWQELEMTAFIHFTVNTFTGEEWGHGTESPKIMRE